MTIGAYCCSVFINKSKYTLENTIYCKLSEVEKFHDFWWIDWQPYKSFPAK